MSRLSKLKKSRENWKGKSVDRGESMRYLRKENKRIKQERDNYKKEAQQAKQLLDKKNQKMLGVTSKVDLIYLALQLFLIAKISFRAVSRVLKVFADALGIIKSPSHQTVINWVLRLSIVKMKNIYNLAPSSITRHFDVLKWQIFDFQFLTC